jgi:hypothetical protein
MQDDGLRPRASDQRMRPQLHQFLLRDADRLYQILCGLGAYRSSPLRISEMLFVSLLKLMILSVEPLVSLPLLRGLLLPLGLLGAKRNSLCLPRWWPVL